MPSQLPGNELEIRLENAPDVRQPLSFEFGHHQRCIRRVEITLMVSKRRARDARRRSGCRVLSGRMPGAGADATRRGLEFPGLRHLSDVHGPAAAHRSQRVADCSPAQWR